MAQINDTQMKTKFENGDIPTQSDFYDFIDSKVNNTIENNIKVNLPGNPSIITVDGNIIINDGAAIKDKNGNVLVNDTGTISGMSDKEDKSNKENTTLDTSVTKYPTNRLVKQEIDISRIASNIDTSTTGVDVQEALDSKENLLNKENTTLDTSVTKYPTNRLVKQEIDISRIASNISTSETGLTVQDHIDNAVIILPQLQDVTLTSPANGESLVYDETTSQWKNGIGVVEGQTEIEINGVRKNLLWKTFTGNTGTGGSVYVAHGLTRASILTVTAKINYTTAIDYYFQQDSGQFYTRTDDTNVAIEAIDVMYNNSPYIITIAHYADYVPAIRGGIIGLGGEEVGSIKEIGGETVPDGWVLCDGKTIGRDIDDTIYPDGSGSGAPDYYGNDYSTLYTKLSEAGSRWGTPIPTGDVPVWGTHKIKLPDLNTGVFVIKFVEPKLVTVLTNPISIIKTESYTILDTDLETVYYFDTGAIDLVCTLPTASDNTDKEILAMKSDGGSGKLSVVDELATFNYDVELQDYGVKVKSNGTKWVIIERINAIVPDSQNLFREVIIDGGFSQWSLRKDHYIRKANVMLHSNTNAYFDTVDKKPHYLSVGSRALVVRGDFGFLVPPAYSQVVTVLDANTFIQQNSINPTILPRQGEVEYIISDSESEFYDFKYSGMNWSKTGTTVTITDTSTIKPLIQGAYIFIVWSSNRPEVPTGAYKVESILTYTSFTITVPTSGSTTGTLDMMCANKPKKASDIYYSYHDSKIIFSGRDEDKPLDIFDSSLRLMDINSSETDNYIGQVIESDVAKNFKNKRVSLSAYVKTDGIIPANTMKYRFRSAIPDYHYHQKIGGLESSNVNITSIAGHMTGASAIAFNSGGTSCNRFYCPHVDEHDISNDFTVSCWVYGDSTQGSNHGMFFNDFTGGGWFLAHYNLGGSQSIQFRDGPGSYTLNLTIADGWTQDAWHHITIVKSSSEGMKIYLDGILIHTLSSAGAKGDFAYGSPPYINIGSSNDNSYPFKGMLEDIRMYNRPLTDAEILEIYTDTATTPLDNTQAFHDTACNHWFKMDETSGMNIKDSSGALMSRNIAIPETFNKNTFTHKCNPDFTVNPTWHDKIAHGLINNTPSQSPTFGTAGRLTGQNCVEFTSANGTRLNTVTPASSIWHGTWTKPFTFSTWVYFKTMGGNYQSIIGDVGGSVPYVNWLIQPSGELYFYIVNGSSTTMYITAPNALLSAGQWYHLTIVYPGYADTRRMQFYINGVKQPISISGNNASGSDIIASSRPFVFGCQVDNNYPLNGYLEDFRLYEYELTEDDVAELYSTTSTTPYAVNQSFNKLPLHQWKFDENAGSTIAYDSTPKWIADYENNLIEGTFTHEQIDNSWVKITAENVLLSNTISWEQGFEVNIIVPKNSIINETGVTLNDVLFSGIHMNEGTIDRGFLPEDKQITRRKTERFYKKYFSAKEVPDTASGGYGATVVNIITIGDISSDYWAYSVLPIKMLKLPTIQSRYTYGCIMYNNSWGHCDPDSNYAPRYQNMNASWMGTTSSDGVPIHYYGQWGNYTAWSGQLATINYAGWLELDARII